MVASIASLVAKQCKLRWLHLLIQILLPDCIISCHFGPMWLPLTHLHEDFADDDVVVIFEHRAEHHGHSVFLGLHVPAEDRTPD